VDRVQNDLAGRLATAFGQYASARQRAERYRREILPAAQESYRLTLLAFRGGQFEYLRVLQAQRTIAEANLSLIQALSEQWRAASEIAGLLLEEEWPSSPVWRTASSR
jgi:cobalt-zinc-cadmium efflux system outer membrane protein